MSWSCRNPSIFVKDLDLLKFSPRQSRLFTIERQDDTPDLTTSFTNTTDAEWDRWLEADLSLQRCSESTRINLILGSRAHFPWGHDPSVVTKLPWSQKIFSCIQKRFFVHSAIIRAMNRNTSCLFSHMNFDWKIESTQERSYVYVCRTAASWPGDMALSVTFLPDTLTTNAVLFGCDFDKPDMYESGVTLADIITSRLKNSDTHVFHPMMIPTIFADTERDRQIELVREKLGELGRRIDDITRTKIEVKTALSFHDEPESPTGSEKSFLRFRLFQGHHSQRSATASSSSSTENTNSGSNPPVTMPVKAEIPTAKLWQQISRLRIGLSNWRRQLLKMIAHAEDLNRVEFAPQCDFPKYTENQRLQFFQAGERIRDRLQELVDEYDEYIRECTHIMDGFSLATQLEISQISRSDAKTNQEISRVNLDVAQMTRRDGSVMKSIAVLGMIFLPASFATAFFSMGFFDVSKEGEGAAVSSLLWIYILAALMLTLGTMATFYVCILKDRKNKVKYIRSPAV